MRLEDALRDLEIGDALDLFAPHWEESAASMPPSGPSFLEPDEFTASREFLDLPEEADELLLTAARCVRETPALLHLAWHCYRLLFEHHSYPGGRIAQWPSLDKHLPGMSGAFYLLIALGVVPLTRSVHRARGIPESIARHSLMDFHEQTDLYRHKHGGAWGVLLKILYWLRNHTTGVLFGLGRLEYMVKPFRGRLQAFRHRETGEVLALAEDGVWFDDQGHAATGNAASEGWTSRLAVDDETVTGSPVSPFGVAVRQEVVLPRAAWRRVLAPGDPVLEVHIAAGGGMTPERCKESMRQALDFFPRYFPERPFVGFTCTSWILNPDLAEFYRPSSNMVLWQRELYLFPWSSHGKAGLFSLFGEDEIDLATAPRDTSLRRAVLDHLAAGRPLRNGGMFLLKEDFQHFGSQHYRQHWPPQALGHDGGSARAATAAR